jgi:hypothetical protein
MKRLNPFSVAALSLLIFGCGSMPRSAESASDQITSNKRVGTVPELGEQEVTIVSSPRATR